MSNDHQFWHHGKTYGRTAVCVCVILSSRKRGMHELRFVQCFVLQGDTAPFGFNLCTKKPNMTWKAKFGQRSVLFYVSKTCYCSPTLPTLFWNVLKLQTWTWCTLCTWCCNVSWFTDHHMLVLLQMISALWSMFEHGSMLRMLRTSTH
jgi:hypothetical protein